MGEIERIARNWYTEQRGRINGNTVAWDDLTVDQRLNILDCVGETFETMEEAWQWPKKSGEVMEQVTEPSIILTNNNVEFVSEATGYSEEQLKNLLDEMEVRGVYPVKIPLNEDGTPAL